MRFGEFLVRSGAVTADALLKGLADQRGMRPFVPSLVVEEGYMTADEALSLLNWAEDTGRDFLDVAMEGGAVSRQQAEVLTARARQVTPPIGQVLVATGVLPPEQNSIHIQEYLKQQRAELNDSVNRN